MATQKKKYFKVGVDVPGAGQVNSGKTFRKKSTRDGKKVEKEYSEVRGSSSQSATAPKTVFIAVLPGSWSLYSSHRGTSMFEDGDENGPFPGIRSMDDIHANRRWVLGVFPGNLSNPRRRDFNVAQYYECPGEHRHIDISEFEAWQAVGRTAMSEKDIRRFASRLWENWCSGDYDQRLWNSQNFVIYLTALILEQPSPPDTLDALYGLHCNLWRKQDARFESMMLRRHGTAMVGMAVFGVATFGLGALGSWAYGVYGILEGGATQGARTARLRHLVHEFPILREQLLREESDGEDSD